MFSVIFDMDGTLLDNQKIYIPAWEYAGRLQGIKGMGEHTKYNFGVNSTSSTRYLEQNCPQLNVALFKKDYENYVTKNLKLQLKDGVLETLDFLKKNNIKIGLATGTSKQAAIERLKSVNVYEYFDAFVFGDDIINGKPAPDIFLKTASLMGVEPEECIIFEDSPNGINAAKSANIKCIGIPDAVPFSDEIKDKLFAHFPVMSDAISLLKQYL